MYFEELEKGKLLGVTLESHNTPWVSAFTSVSRDKILTLVIYWSGFFWESNSYSKVKALCEM